MHDPDVDKCFQDSIKSVVYAGKIAKNKLHTAKITHFKDRDDLVTDSDLLVEDIIFKYITRKFPAHGFNSEEKGIYQGDAEYIWVLDPIDGTKYYARGLPLYSISLGLEYKGKVIQGIVYLPETEQLFCANRYVKNGSELNNQRIQCSHETELKNIDVCLEIPSRNAPPENIKEALEKIGILITHTRRVRILGVGSIGLCYCAAGGFDLYCNLGSCFSYYDYAAGKVIVEQAGGEFRLLENSIIAGNSRIIERAMELLDLV